MSQPHKVFALIDCNNFFVSCERVFRPDTWDKPAVVLSNNDGCVIARSNEVKAMGIPMAVPLFKVRDQLAQHNTVIFSANFALYGDLSQRITSLISATTPHVEVYSVDESFADLTELPVTDYEKWGRHIKEEIWRCTGVPVSVGVGSSKTLAKAAADYAKKQSAADGVHVALDAHRLDDLLKWLPLEDVWGIGRRLAPKLRLQGVRSAYDFTKIPDKWIQRELTVKGLTTVLELRGQSVIPFDSGVTVRKTIGRSRAFGHTVRAVSQLESAVATFTAQAAAKLRAQGSIAGTVVTYLRTSRHAESFRSLATATPLAEPTADTGKLIQAAHAGLIRIYDEDFAYQKAGVVLLDIASREDWQLSLTDPDSKRDAKAKLMHSVDHLNKKFGPNTVWHAAQDVGSARWHSKHLKRSPAYTTSWSDLPIIKG
jgi:DNA polymerase V